jgi:uracil-DNA glycosylase family 4|tara:strand:- start:4148 stop:4735 length:588 start_codon:yes stop_codon:yes gene_type:complete
MIELKVINSEIRDCKKCGTDVANFPQPGHFKGKILIILQNPAYPRSMSLTQRQIIGSKQTLEEFQEDYKNRIYKSYMGTFVSMMFDNWDDISITNIVKCPTFSNASPSQKICSNCQSYTFQQIEQLQPKLIICVGHLCKKVIFDWDKKNKYQKIAIRHYGFLQRSGISLTEYTASVKRDIEKKLNVANNNLSKFV